MKQKSSILAIDRGKKYIGCAYALEGSTVVFPIGYMINDKTVIEGLRDTIQRYRVKHILIGLPHDTWAKGQIEGFATMISRVIDATVIVEFVNEDYTSVQAGEKVNNFTKNVAEDTLAAMIILERWIAAEEERKQYEQLKNPSL